MSTAANVYRGLAERAINQPALEAAALVVQQLKDHAALESESEATMVAGMAVQLHDARLELERERKKILDPLNEARQAIFDSTKPRLDLFDQGERLAKQLVGDWNRKKEAAHREQLAAEQARQVVEPDGPPEAVVHSLPPSTITRSMGRTMHEATVWKVVIVDKAQAIMARADLFDLREKDAMQLLKAGVVIPGLKLEAEKTQVIR